jgi:4-hydroxybenzoate polyprenyltransferase
LLARDGIFGAVALLTRTRLTGLVRACHPEPTVAVTAIATALALSAGARAGWVAAAFLSGQLVTGWTNDWVDRDRDAEVGRADKPVASGAVPVALVRGAALTAGAACVPLSLAMGRAAGVWHLVAVTSALAYDLRLKATLLSWAPYALSFGLVPSVITLGTPAHAWAPWWATAAGALLGVGGHLANVLPDLDDDAATGVRGLPHRLGRGPSTILTAVLLLAATLLLVLGPGAPGAGALAALGLAAAVTAAGLAAARRPGSRAAFLAVLVVAGLDVALLVARGAQLG